MRGNIDRISSIVLQLGSFKEHSSTLESLDDPAQIPIKLHSKTPPLSAAIHLVRLSITPWIFADSSLLLIPIGTHCCSMAPLILHNVPDEELYIGEDGVQRPYAMIYPQYASLVSASASSQPCRFFSYMPIC